MRHTISVLVENEFGVLSRVAGLFSGRGFNIESLSVAETLDPSVSRITLVTMGDDQVLAQVTKQLNKLIPVIKVTDFKDTHYVEREMALVKVRGHGEKRVEALRIADIFRARVVDSTNESFVFEIIGQTTKLNAFIGLMQPLGLVDVARTGVVAIARGPEPF